MANISNKAQELNLTKKTIMLYYTSSYIQCMTITTLLILESKSRHQIPKLIFPVEAR